MTPPIGAVEPREVFDRTTVAPSVLEVLRRRIDGGYALDAFGADPQLQDMVAPIAERVIRLDIINGERIPTSGAATLVSNRGFGIAEPFVLALAAREAAGRRLRLEGSAPLPVVRDLSYKLGALGFSADDVRAALHAGHLVGIPLAPTWWRTGAGTPPREVMLACTGAPMIPVAVKPGGPFGLAIRPWRVVVGEPIAVPAGVASGDPLVAAELGDRVQRAVRELLDA